MRLTPEIVEAAEKKVKKSPRGAPITLEAPVEAPAEPQEAPKPPERPCTLDQLPIGSKLVVVRDEGRRPVLMTPDGEVSCPRNDLAWTVPEGAKVMRHGEQHFVAEMLGDAQGRKPLVTDTAREALEQFNTYFG